MRIAGDSGKAPGTDRAVVVVSVDQIGRPCRPDGGCDEEVEPVGGQQLVDPFGPGQAQAVGACFAKGLRIGRLFGLLEDLLAEPAQLGRVGPVVGNGVGQRADRDVRR